MRKFFMAGYRKAVGLSLTVLTMLTSCQARPESVELDECVAYSNALDACFGPRMGEEVRRHFVASPADRAQAEALRAQCAEQHSRLRRSCR